MYYVLLLLQLKSKINTEEDKQINKKYFQKNVRKDDWHGNNT